MDFTFGDHEDHPKTPPPRLGDRSTFHSEPRHPPKSSTLGAGRPLPAPVQEDNSKMSRCGQHMAPPSPMRVEPSLPERCSCPAKVMSMFQISLRMLCKAACLIGSMPRSHAFPHFFS